MKVGVAGWLLALAVGVHEKAINYVICMHA